MTSKGQVTIPKRIRDATGLKPGIKVDVAMEDGRAVLKPAGKAAKSDFAKQLQKLRGSLKGQVTTEEIMRLTRGWS